MLNIEYTPNPSAKDIDFLMQAINRDMSDQEPVSVSAFFIRDTRGEIIAGCNFFIICGAIYIDQLWVHRDWRKQGLASKLLHCVHEYGVKQRCTMATVTTMSFQAEGFYKKLGYEVDFRRSGYTNDASAIFLSRKI